MMNNAISYLGKPFQKIPEAAGQRALVNITYARAVKTAAYPTLRAGRPITSMCQNCRRSWGLHTKSTAGRQAMRDSKRKACPDVAASRQAAGMEAARKAAPYIARIVPHRRRAVKSGSRESEAQSMAKPKRATW